MLLFVYVSIGVILILLYISALFCQCNCIYMFMYPIKCPPLCNNLSLQHFLVVDNNTYCDYSYVKQNSGGLCQLTVEQGFPLMI